MKEQSLRGAQSYSAFSRFHDVLTTNVCAASRGDLAILLLIGFLLLTTARDQFTLQCKVI
jgi:hypothetical protein